MTLYRYKAITAEGTLKQGYQEAPSSDELKVNLRRQGLTLISFSRKLPSVFSRKVTFRSLMDLCLHLRQFEKAGIPLKISLEELATVLESKPLKHILKSVIEDVESGSYLSQALLKHPTIFDPVFIGMIVVGEKTGSLPIVLDHLSHYYKWREETQTLTFKALRYPFILVCVVTVLISVILTVLVPELTVFIQNFSEDLPLSTHILIGISEFLSESHILFLSFASGLLILLGIIKKVYPEDIDRFFNTLPMIGPLKRKLALFKFFYVFTLLFESGVDVLSALHLSRITFKPGEMSRSLMTIERRINEGSKLSQAFEKERIFPKMVIHMMRMGEQTSALPQSLHHVKDSLEVILKRQIEMCIGLIEPVLILCMGGILAWIIYALFLPLYDTLSRLE